jgi:hypothetical protein
MRFSLRTLVIATMLIPPLIAGVWWYPVTSLVAVSLLSILPIPTRKRGVN